jgi:hypothetical protein
MPQLIKAEVSFYTPPNSDNKDPDTRLTVTIKNSNRDVVARISDYFAEFPDDGSTRGPYLLEIKEPTPSYDGVLRGTVTIRIDPDGSDTWVFNFELVLVFDDGSHLGSFATGLVLTEDRREQSFGLQKVQDKYKLVPREAGPDDVG